MHLIVGQIIIFFNFFKIFLIFKFRTNLVMDVGMVLV